MSLRRRQSIAAGVLAAIVIAAVILIATSGENSTSTAPTVTATTAGQRPAQGALSADLKACFEDNGVEDPSAALQHAGAPSPELTRAFEACEKYLPQGETSTHSPGAAQPLPAVTTRRPPLWRGGSADPATRGGRRFVSTQWGPRSSPAGRFAAATAALAWRP